MRDRAGRIACLMAGLETPDDLTEQEQTEHRDDLLAFLQAEYDKETGMVRD